jgi:hypothetical protein
LTAERSWNGDNQLINAGILAVTMPNSRYGESWPTGHDTGQGQYPDFRLALTTAISAG